MATTYYYSIEGQILGQQVLGEAEGKNYLLDASGNLVGVYQGDYLKADASYDPFGNILDSWNISFYNFTWAGGHGYRQTGLAFSSVYVRARHYSNLDAGWTTRDPLWPSEMPYGYVDGRVPGGVDPSGMQLSTSGVAIGTKTDPCCECEKQEDICEFIGRITQISNDPDVAGFTACCNGKATACVNQKSLDAIINHINGLIANPITGNDRAKIKNCVKIHENKHAQQYNEKQGFCSGASVYKSYGGATFESKCGLAAPKSHGKTDETECQAYQAELNCLMNAFPDPLKLLHHGVGVYICSTFDTMYNQYRCKRFGFPDKRSESYYKKLRSLCDRIR